MEEHLRNSGIKDEQIIEMDFEKYEFGKMTGDSFYKYERENFTRSKSKDVSFLMKSNVSPMGRCCELV